MHLCHLDIKNAFYLLELPPPLRTLFGLKPVRARDVKVRSLNGSPVDPNQYITPVFRAVPMGWTHALAWCQRLHEELARRSGMSPELRVADRRPGPRLSEHAVHHIEYVDNFYRSVLG